MGAHRTSQTLIPYQRPDGRFILRLSSDGLESYGQGFVDGGDKEPVTSEITVGRVGPETAADVVRDEVDLVRPFDGDRETRSLDGVVFDVFTYPANIWSKMKVYRAGEVFLQESETIGTAGGATIPVDRGDAMADAWRLVHVELIERAAR